MTDQPNDGASVLEILPQSMRTQLTMERLALMRVIAELQEELAVARNRIAELEQP